MTPTLDDLRERGALSALDVHFARTIGRLGCEDRAAVLLAAAMVSRQVSNGHVCLDLQALARAPGLYDDSGRLVCGPDWPSTEEWRTLLRDSSLVGDGARATPLVLDAADRLYLHRYWEYETRLAAALTARGAAAEQDTIDSAWLREMLDRLFPPDPTGPSMEMTVCAEPAPEAGAASVPADNSSVTASQAPFPTRSRRQLAASRRADSEEDQQPPLQGAGPDWQRVAAVVALTRYLCVISGGPGTGKTHAVLNLLALLVAWAFSRGRPAPRVLLLAPTGKAAARLKESIRERKARLRAAQPSLAAVLDAIPEEAATIHRGLGATIESRTRFRHDARNPLIAQVVVVDEASMVDLALMARLVAAVPPAARLVLLGDKDQLASVEAGAVLGDICNTGRPRGFSPAFAERFAALYGERLPSDEGAPADTGIGDCIVHLTRSRRYGIGSGIGQLASAINGGDVARVFELLASAEYPDISWEEGTLGRAVPPRLGVALLAGYAPYLSATDPMRQLMDLRKFRVLCAHRRGRRGGEDLNAQIEQVLAGRGLIDPSEHAYLGRPVMVTRNDYSLALFNGDVGVVVRDPRRLDGRMVAFEGDEGGVRLFAPARLPPHETVYAMSVHKSQGSEFDEVAIVLPAEPSPVTSRELLYTAVTRAKTRVSIFGPRDVIAHAVRNRVERHSGLRAALWRGAVGA